MIIAAVRTRPSAVSEISSGAEAIISQVISAICRPKSASPGLANCLATANRAAYNATAQTPPSVTSESDACVSQTRARPSLRGTK